MIGRKHLSTTARQAIFDRHRGICHLCQMPIDRERWEVSHPIPLGLGGGDDAINHAPAHARCHAVETRTKDIPAIAKMKRQRAGYTGAKARSFRPMPGGRFSRDKIKMDGTVVDRLTGIPRGKGRPAPRGLVR